MADRAEDNTTRAAPDVVDAAVENNQGEERQGRQVAEPANLTGVRVDGEKQGGSSVEPELASEYASPTDIDSQPISHVERHPSDSESRETDTTEVTDTAKEATASGSSKPRRRFAKWNPLRWGKTPPVPDERAVSREYTAGFFSKLTFHWMTPLMTTGYRRQLEDGDLWAVNPDRAVHRQSTLVKESFKRRVQAGHKRPLIWALNECFKVEFWLGGLCALSSSVLQVVSPFTLRYLIQYATDAYYANVTGTQGPPIGNGIGLAIGITIMQVLQSLAINHFIYRGMLVGGASRGVLINLVYEKAMVISARAKAGEKALGPVDAVPQDRNEKQSKRGENKKPQGDGIGWANGRVVNLMSVDTYRIDQAAGLFHLIWASPVACLITLVLLLVNLTYSALAGFGLLVVAVPALTFAIRSLFRRQKKINKVTDQRVSLTQEILQSVRFVKFFGWEEAFISRLGEYRAKEIHAIQLLLAIRNAINAVSMSMPIFASMLAFITYSLSSHSLAPAEVFSSLALFNSLRLPLNFLPLVIGQVTDAWSSFKRIEEFLMEEEQEEEVTYSPEGPNAVELHDASFTWERVPTQESDKAVDGALAKIRKDRPSSRRKSAQGAKSTLEDEKAVASKTVNEATRPVSAGKESFSTFAQDREPFKLHDLNLKAGRNELIAVIGSVGSGKSSLLAALAGDMRKLSGEVVLGASRAFCPQYAWIQNAKLQENITFGKEMDERWYTEVVAACALQADLDMLPHGDQTEVGERGIVLSGGQKQRLNIARAIYFDADIVLMDDPLSAVDAHVGRHIFDHAILGLMKDKCRVLTTHQLWVLSRCDRIVWVEDGHIQAIDTFDHLMRDHRGFQSLMETTASEEKRETPSGGDEQEVADLLGEPKKLKKSKKNAMLMQQEDKAVSSIPWSVYGAYIRASGSILNLPLIIFVLVLSQGANITTSLWLSYWTSNRFNLGTGQYIGVYAGLGALQAFLMFLFAVSLTILGTNASKVMLRNAVKRVLRAPMSFFETTPLGRITNRFSRDVDVMDNNLTDAIRMYFFTVAMVTAVFALIIAYFHWFAVALVPLYFFILAASYYRASAREVKRYESLKRSHVFAKFGEGLTGVASIRAYGLKPRFIHELQTSIDEMNGAYYLTFSNQRWLSLRLDLIGNCLVFTVGILVVTSRLSVDPSIAGLVLSYILSIVQMLQFLVRQLAEVENGMNAVERIQHYGTQIEQEAPLHTIDVRKTWPEKGEIIFDDVRMTYRKDLPLVLKGLSMHVRSGERIGIVGRTGAGKSSILSALFRLVEISSGSITIDGLNISTIGLHDLRSRLAIIPQDPTLFQGTVRSNLDPFHEHTDLELASALRQADLIPDESVEGHRAPAARCDLDSVVEENGLNFSLGQRQLLALARALVRGSQIIVCDEATSSVDVETDDKIQHTMATAFRGKTLLCIAHRLRTVISFDRVCVIENGAIAELDAPLALWKRGATFRGMCDRSGITEMLHGSAPKSPGSS